MMRTLSLVIASIALTSVECFVSSSASRPQTALSMGLLKELSEFIGLGGPKFEAPAVMGDESIMKPKAHGTSETPVQDNLRWNCDRKTADNICNFNRH